MKKKEKRFSLGNVLFKSIGDEKHHIQPMYNSNDKCPNSLDIFNRSLALPMYYMLKEEDIDVAAALLKKSNGGISMTTRRGNNSPYAVGLRRRR
ncbi:hypothetical protein C5S29_01590 [ANME-1 cluster archaeon GoMg3.2]|nr:hypothetical protein [ANME-1 cluster archaeon GoMg3.2]